MMINLANVSSPKNSLFVITVFSVLLANFVYADDIYSDAWAVLMKRRAVPIEMAGENKTIDFDAMSFLKLTRSEIVLTFKKGPEKRDAIYILATLCENKDNVILSDAVALETNETGREFIDRNLRFIVNHNENIEYTLCMRPGGELTIDQFGSDANIVESKHRVCTFLNHWIRFFSSKKKDVKKAAELFDNSIEIQSGELLGVVNSNNAEDLNLLIKYFDYSDPLFLMQIPNTRAEINISKLKEYLKITTYIRQKLLGFFPEHEEKLGYEKRLLQSLNSK